nr:putative glycolipid-binding domain-containing protein [Polycladomyces sp. WAk]
MWKRLDSGGYEQVTLQEKQDGWLADGVGVWLESDQLVRFQYWVQTDQWWRTREVVVCLQNQEDSAPIRLISDGRGHWRDAFGRPVPVLDGCVDVDLNITPFTNTIAIRRLGLNPTDTEMIRVAYVDVPGLRWRPVSQRYTCIARTADEAVYRYEGLDTGFAAELRVDAEGGVIDYPGCFEQVWRKTTIAAGGTMR